MPAYKPRSRAASFTAKQRVAIAERDKWICQDCHRITHNGNPRSPLYMHAGHIVAHVDGGKPIISNGKCVCRECNQSAGGTEMVARRRNKLTELETENELLKAQVIKAQSGIINGENNSPKNGGYLFDANGGASRDRKSVV